MSGITYLDDTLLGERTQNRRNLDLLWKGHKPRFQKLSTFRILEKIVEAFFATLQLTLGF
jgi:hypothetical protein